MRAIVVAISLLVAGLCVMHLTGCDTGSETPAWRSGHVTIEYLRLPFFEQSTAIGHDIWIEGMVVANDIVGETQRCFVLYDGTAGIEVEVDTEDVDRLIPLYSQLRIHCLGLSLGRQGRKMVLGLRPTSHYVVDRIAPDKLYNYVTFVDDIPYPISPNELRIGEVSLSDMLHWVVIRDAQFVRSEYSEWCMRDSLNQPLTTTHLITDERDTMRVVVAGSVAYATEPLPHGSHNLHGIVDWHDGDMALRIINHVVVE